MRVLCSITPMEGVFAPVMPLATALIQQGRDVLVATAADLIERARFFGFAAAVAGPTAAAAVADRCGDVCPHHGRREATCVAHTHR